MTAAESEPWPDFHADQLDERLWTAGYNVGFRDQHGDADDAFETLPEWVHGE
jgi:hypothetical protein